MERQVHGFIFEEDVIIRYNIVKSKGYTSKYDGEINGVPVSIKLEKKGTDIEMADIFRNAANNEDFFLIVGFWEDEKTNIVEEYFLKIPKEFWQQQFSQELLSQYASLLKEITNKREDDEKWKSAITKLRKEWSTQTPNIVRPRPKRDHKVQKRVQCAINNKLFYSVIIPQFIEKGEI